MGCSSSGTFGNNSQINNSINNNNKDNLKDKEVQNLEKDKLKQLSPYYSFKFSTSKIISSNLLLFTNIENTGSEFTSVSEVTGERQEKLSFKSSNHCIALGYRKGYKLEFVNQDKFFILLDGNLEAFCVIDGHGPFGDKVAQISQDLFFTFVKHINRTTFYIDYQKEFNAIFDEVNHNLINRNEKEFGNYDPFLSGIAVTIVIKLNNIVYCANVGNVLALVFISDKLMPSKYNITELTFNDSNFSELTLDCPEETKKTNANNSDIIIDNIISPSDIIFEIRRIYEHGGELRKLQGETKSRIFVKGKYFPGLINTRSLGDQIGKGIGVLSSPHITKLSLVKENNYFLLICSDGISNACNTEKLGNLVHVNDSLLLESINNIISESKSLYRAHLYSPDMTVALKELKYKDEEAIIFN